MGFQLGEFGRIIIEVFLFSLTFTYPENSEIKVTVKLTGSMVHITLSIPVHYLVPVFIGE